VDLPKSEELQDLLHLRRREEGKREGGRVRGGKVLTSKERGSFAIQERNEGGREGREERKEGGREGGKRGTFGETPLIPRIRITKATLASAGT
jgi:hypothetical protein